MAEQCAQWQRVSNARLPWTWRQAFSGTTIRQSGGGDDEHQFCKQPRSGPGSGPRWQGTRGTGRRRSGPKAPEHGRARGSGGRCMRVFQVRTPGAPSEGCPLHDPGLPQVRGRNGATIAELANCRMAPGNGRWSPVILGVGSFCGPLQSSARRCAIPGGDRAGPMGMGSMTGAARSRSSRQ
jgi:hypothetical protein